LCDFAISFEFHLLSQKFQFGVDLRVSLLGTYVFSKTVTLHRHENKYTLVVNSLCTVQ